MRWEEIAASDKTWLFQPQPGEIACFAKDESVLLRWNGRKWRRQTIPFDPSWYTLHRTDDRGVIWVGRTKEMPWYRIDTESVQSFPNEAAANAAALAEGARQFVGNYGATAAVTNDPAFSGGFFHYPEITDNYFKMAPAVRTFGNQRILVGMQGTPFSGDYLMRICEDLAGGVWFLVSSPHSRDSFKSPHGRFDMRSKNTRLFHYTPPNSNELAFTAPTPATCGRSLDLSLKPWAARSNRALLYRVAGMPWERLENGAPHACFRFPTNGVYECQVIAFDYGGKIPGSASFTVTASMELPETGHDGAESSEPILITAHPWYPPVRAIPTTGGGAVRVLWQTADEEDWHPIDPASGVSVAALKRGKQTLRFHAEEEGFWRDPTPLRLEVCVALSLDDYLACLAKEANSADPSIRARADHALRNCMPEARERIAELENMANRGNLIREGLQVFSVRSQKIPQPLDILKTEKGGQQ